MTEQTKKGKPVKDTDYLFLSALLRAREPKLLSREKAERMLAGSAQEALRLLESCGYEDVQTAGLEAALGRRRAQTFQELEQLAPKTGIVALFRMRYDYHNAKTIIKAEASGHSMEGITSEAGRVSAQALKDAYESGESGSVPQPLLQAMAQARDVLSRTSDPQLADMILDCAYYAEYAQAARQTGSAFLEGYAALSADCANLRAAVRARRMQKDAAFLREVLAEGGSVPAEAICQALQQQEPFAPLFGKTTLFDAAQAGDASQGGSLTQFERQCDDTLMAYLATAKQIVFGEQVLVAYLCALETEISAARMIVNGLQAGIPADTIRTRLRRLYM